MKLHISPFTYLFYAFMLLFCHDRTVIASVSAVLIHEAAHLAVIALCKCRIEHITVTPIGLSIGRTGLTSHLQDFAIYFSGPLANFAAAGILAFCFGQTDLLPITANLYFGLLNLLPIEALDGGKAFSALLSIQLHERLCRCVCKILSCVCLLLLWMASIAILLMLDGNASLLLFCSGLFCSQVNNRSN